MQSESVTASFRHQLRNVTAVTGDQLTIFLTAVHPSFVLLLLLLLLSVCRAALRSCVTASWWQPTRCLVWAA
jgi:hypothetical protein